MKLTGYSHFVQLAESLQWDETTLDFSADIEAWQKLEDAEREQLFGLVAGFCIAEAAVAQHLTNFQGAATVDDSMAECFRSQARDEARHSRFFDRVAGEVIGVPGTTRERLDFLRGSVNRDLVELFEGRLPAMAQRLADDQSNLSAAVGLYHMVLEGVVLLAGQNSMLDTLESLSVRLPGVQKGMELVLRDERWHIGFGSRIVQSADLVGDDVESILAQGEAAAKAWGNLTSNEAIDSATQQHRRRLRSVGIKFW